MTATLDLTTTVLPDICTEHNCREATSHPDTCVCSCGGEGHGIRAQVERAVGGFHFQARPDVQPSGFTTAMLAALDDDEIF